MTLAIVVMAGKEIELDEDGFIQTPELWDDRVAAELASWKRASSK